MTTIEDTEIRYYILPHASMLEEKARFNIDHGKERKKIVPSHFPRFGDFEGDRQLYNSSHEKTAVRVRISLLSLSFMVG